MKSLSSEQRRFLEEATLRYAKSAEEVVPFLEARGIDRELVASTAIGVVRDPLPQHAHLEGFMSIPYLTDFGPVNLRFRCMREQCDHDGHGKYHTPAGWPADIYGVQQFDEADDWIAVCEGELDSLILRKAGIPAVGIPGVSVWHPWWPNVFEDYARIYVIPDGDQAGSKMWDKWKTMENTIRVKLPQGLDVTDFVLKYGLEAMSEKVKR